MNRSEPAGVFEAIDAVMTAIATLMHPNVEGVMHDVERDKIVRLWNPYSGRVVGGDSLLDSAMLQDLGSGEVIGPYEQVGIDGRPLVSVSVPVLDGRYLLCINVDRTAIDDAISLLANFVAAVRPRPSALFDKDWRSGINDLTEEWCRANRRRRDDLTREERLEIVTLLDDAGLFATRHAAPHAARALGVSRATIYKLLKSAREAATGEV